MKRFVLLVPLVGTLSAPLGIAPVPAYAASVRQAAPVTSLDKRVKPTNLVWDTRVKPDNFAWDDPVRVR